MIKYLPNSDKYLTEDEHIELALCLEKLESIGIADIDIEDMLLRCNICPIRGRCDVDSGNIFLGAKTC